MASTHSYEYDPNLHTLNLETAEKSIRLLATAFFHQDLKTLEAHFGISPLQMDEAFEALENHLGKDDFTSLAPPPIGSQLVLEKDEICADDENSSIRRSEEHTSELQSPDHLVCRLLLEKKKNDRQL